MIKVNRKILKEIYQARPKDAHKYDFGLLLVIGGGEFYTGSPYLSAMSAFRTGVDMVYVIAPKRAADIIASFSPNLASFPLEGERLTKDHLSTLFSLVKSAKAVSGGKCALVIGGGMGRSPQTQETICQFLKDLDLPSVIDADGLYAISKNPKVVYGKPFILTPHQYEFFVLTGKKVLGKSLKEKIEILKEASKKFNSCILLKGRIDIAIISQGEKIAINKTGHPNMTVGGTGDTLAGIIGAFLTWKIDPFKSACAGAYLNGLAGERVAKRLGWGMTATDLIEEIPKIIPKK